MTRDEVIAIQNEHYQACNEYHAASARVDAAIAPLNDEIIRFARKYAPLAIQMIEIQFDKWAHSHNRRIQELKNFFDWSEEITVQETNLDGNTLVTVRPYVGGGDYETYQMVFPTRWLWEGIEQAEAEVEQIKNKHESDKIAEKKASAKRQRDWERETFERLRKKFGKEIT